MISGNHRSLGTKNLFLSLVIFFLFDLFQNKLDGYCLQKIFIEPIQVHFKSYFKYLKLLKVCLTWNVLHSVLKTIKSAFNCLNCIAEIRAYRVETKPSEIDNPRHHYQIAFLRCLCRGKTF